MTYCNCHDREPTVPVFRDVMTHLPDCPQFGSGWPVGAEFKWKDSAGRAHIDLPYCPCRPNYGRTFREKIPVLIHQSQWAKGETQ